MNFESRIDPARTAPVEAAETLVDARAAWQRTIAGWLALVVAILLLFRRDFEHLYGIWTGSDTYGHCILIPPIIGWLIWQRREGLAKLAPKPFLPALGAMFGCGLLWLLGEMAGVALVRHAAVVVMLIASVVAVFGLAVSRGLTFLLFFALFLIPVGDQLVPYLQKITADFCILLLDLFGVPAFRDGVFIAIPTGNFEVAEACSGVRFLIAMVAFGALVANVCFKSWTRRIIFMAAAVILPIIANGLRAWGTIYIAHLTTPEFARGVDHVVYGWVFFAIVMVLLMAGSWRFFDRPADDPMIDPKTIQPRPQPSPPVRKVALASVAAIAVAAAAPAYAAYVDSRTTDVATEALRLPTPAGWQPAQTAGFVPWKPHYAGATAESLQSYRDPHGQPVELYIAVFDKQAEGSELIGVRQGVTPRDTPWTWARSQPAPAGAQAMQINGGGAVRDVVQFYWVNGKLVGSPYQAKMEGLKAKLFGGPTQAATVVVSAERRDSLVSARPAIDRFITAMGPVDQLIAQSIVSRPRS